LATQRIQGGASLQAPTRPFFADDIERFGENFPQSSCENRRAAAPAAAAHGEGRHIVHTRVQGPHC
jgi:hypothetical protein